MGVDYAGIHFLKENLSTMSGRKLNVGWGRRFSNARSRKAFTLVEMISVLIIVSVVGLIALKSSPQTGYAILQSETDLLKAHLRYSQLRSIAQEHDFWGLRVNGANWSLYKNQCYADQDLPGEKNTTANPPIGHTCPTGMAIKVDNATGRYVSFNNWGEPYKPNNINSPTLAQLEVWTADIVITLTYAGASKSFTVTPYTGYLR